MGDHHIGRTMADWAALWWESHAATPPSPAQALATLDAICSSYRGRDAEFESQDPANPTQIHPDYDEDTDPQAPLGRLIAIAFEATPAELAPDTDDAAPWQDGPLKRFVARYGFC